MRSPHTITKRSPGSLQLEKNLHSKEDPAQPKLNKYIHIKEKKSILLAHTRPLSVSIKAEWRC